MGTIDAEKVAEAVINALKKLAELAEKIGKAERLYREMWQLLEEPIKVADAIDSFFKVSFQDNVPEIEVDAEYSGLNIFVREAKKDYVEVECRRSESACYVEVGRRKYSINTPTLKELIELALYEQKTNVLTKLISEVEKVNARLAEDLEKLRKIVAAIQLVLT